MNALAAAADPSLPWGRILIIVAIWAAGYFVACAVWPWTACGHCEGGKKRSPSGKAWRPCRRCKGTGRKVRLGRRIWTYAAATNKASK